MGARDRGVWRFGCSETTTAPARSLHVVAERRSSPAGNSHAYHRTPPNTTEIDGVPPIEDILQSLRRLNAEFQIKKRCELRAKKLTSLDQYHLPLKSPSPREPAPIIPDPTDMRRASSHRIDGGSFQKSDRDLNQMRRPQSVISEAPLISSTAVMDPSLKRMEVGVERLGRLVQSAEKQVEMILSQVRDLSGKFLESSSPQLHHHREHVYHQEIPEASALPVPLFKQLVIKSIESVEPALIVHDPVDWRDDVDEVSGQKLQEVVAHQVFEEMPQPTTQTFDDDSEVTKSQKPDATQANNPSKGLEIYHVQKASEVEINLLNDDAKLELSSYVKEVQDCIIVFPVIEIEELSYVVEVDCKLDIDSVTLVAAYYFQVMRPNGAVKVRMGVG